MRNKIKDLEFTIYKESTPQRLDLLTDGENFLISQHISDRKKVEKITIPHTHNYYELEMIIHGEAIETLNGEEFVAKTGNFVFLSPNDVHTCDFGKNEDKVILLVIKIKNEIFTPKLIKILQVINFPITGNLSKDIYEYIGCSIEKLKDAQKQIEDKEIFKAMAHRMLEALILYIISQNNHAKEYVEYVNNKNNGMMNAIIYIRENYNKNLSLQSIAKKFGYSYNYFSNRFKEITGTTFIDYINKMRLNHAYSKIILTNDSLEDIAFSVGFSNFSYFYRKFKEKYGYPPGKIRKKEN